MLAERDIQVLHGIVDLYVREGVPVSSERLQKQLYFAVSTATIRSTMARLEGEGYLAKPHTSAGRVPTDAGYRSYVDGLDANHAYADRFTEHLRDDINQQDVDVVAIMASASKALGGMSKNFAMVYGCMGQESRVGRVQVVRLEGCRLLVAVNLTPDYEKTHILRTEREFAPSVVARAEEWINAEVRGKTLREARAGLDVLIRDNVTDEGIIAREVAVHREDIFSEPPALQFYFEEREHMLGDTGFSDPKLVHLLLLILQDKRYLTSLLATRTDETQVTIGSEHAAEELQPFSLVTAGYRMGVARGVLGVIGPTRMRYDLVYALVGSAARSLEAIGEEFF
jgi:heat-inducible transcriptional repressor